MKVEAHANGPPPSERPPPAPIRVALVEDQRDIREGLAVLINGTPGYRCTGSYRSMEEALPAIASVSISACPACRASKASAR